MKAPLLVRVDDRLIHGQVVTSWVTQLKCKNIVIVDDGVAADAFLTEVVNLAAPTGTEVQVLSIGEALANFSAFENALVLLKTPLTALALQKEGLPFKRLVLGGMGARPGRKKLYRNIAASEEELIALNELVEKGVIVVFQIIATDRPIPYKIRKA